MRPSVPRLRRFVTPPFQNDVLESSLGDVPSTSIRRGGVMRVRSLPLLVILSLLVLFPVAAHTASKPKAKAAPAPPSALAGLELYAIDGGHSAVQFSIAWFGLSHVHGTFSDIRASMT